MTIDIIHVKILLLLVIVPKQKCGVLMDKKVEIDPADEAIVSALLKSALAICKVNGVHRDSFTAGEVFETLFKLHLAGQKKA